MSPRSFYLDLTSTKLSRISLQSKSYGEIRKCLTTIKKIAVKFSDEKGTGFEVFPYDKNLDYTNPNFKGESSEILRTASITNLESIKDDVIKMKECTILKHKKEHP